MQKKQRNRRLDDENYEEALNAISRKLDTRKMFLCSYNFLIYVQFTE